MISPCVFSSLTLNLFYRMTDTLERVDGQALCFSSKVDHLWILIWLIVSFFCILCFLFVWPNSIFSSFSSFSSSFPNYHLDGEIHPIAVCLLQASCLLVSFFRSYLEASLKKILTSNHGNCTRRILPSYKLSHLIVWPFSVVSVAVNWVFFIFILFPSMICLWSTLVSAYFFFPF